MTEIAKTAVFVLVGVATLGVALLIDLANRPEALDAGPRDQVGKPLFDDFDVLKVTDLEVVKWDEDTGTPRFFRVAQVNDVWSIPSHSNYPADAEDQLEKAAPSVMGLNVIDFVSENPGDFSEYGVVDPGAEKIESGTTGVGTRVVMKDARDKELVALVIGKEVPDREDLHYVRKIGQDPIYIVDVDTSKLSTKFHDWIEKDLLKLSTWDIKQIRVLDYSFDELAGRPRIRGQFAVEYTDTGDTRWKLLDSKTLNPETGEWTDRTLGDQEELNTETLNDMKYALDELEIVDVARKPAGLSANLKSSGELKLDQEAMVSLAQRGFYLVPYGRDQVELLSNEGEARVVMKDGVQYTLRFGEIVEDTSGGEAKADEEEAGEGETGEETEGEGEDETEKSDSDLNRYIFVMAEFNPDLIPKPELEPLPELPEGADGDAAEKPDEQPSGQQQPDDKKPAGENADEGKEPKPETGADTPDAPAETPGAPGEAGSEGEPGEEAAGQPADGAEQPPSAPAEAPAAPAETPAAPAETPAAPAETPAAPAETPSDTPAEAGQPAEPAEPAPEGEEPAETPEPEEKEPTVEEIKKERERIEKENQRKQDEYDKKLEDGRKRVDELNDRFADWYYVISDEVYQKIHLSFDQIVKEKEKEDEDGEETGDATTGDATTGDATTGDAASGDAASGDAATGEDGGDAAGEAPDEPKSPIDELDSLEKEGPEGGEK